MIHLRHDGLPLSVVLYERLGSLPRQNSNQTTDYCLQKDFPAEHSADEVGYYYNHAVVSVYNVGAGCLCHCPYLCCFVPWHLGAKFGTNSLEKCEKPKTFDADRLEYFRMYECRVLGDGLFTFVLGRGISDILNWLANDDGHWSLDVANLKVRDAWGRIPRLTNQKAVAEYLLA